MTEPMTPTHRSQMSLIGSDRRQMESDFLVFPVLAEDNCFDDIFDDVFPKTIKKKITFDLKITSDIILEMPI